MSELEDHWYEVGYKEGQSDASEEITRLRAEIERLRAEKDEALNELDAIYNALGTADAEGAPDAATIIATLFKECSAAICERDEARAYAVKRSEEYHREELAIHARAESAERERDNLQSDYNEALRANAEEVCAVTKRAEAAERKVERLREALEPFSKLRATRFMTNGIRYEFRIDAAWIRWAETALKETGPEDGS